jgi:hypothetical protein
MANYLTVGGLTQDQYGTMAINQPSPLQGGCFSGWDPSLGGYQLGSNCVIDTPNVTTIPASIVSNNQCNGETANCGVVNQDGGSGANRIEYGIAGTLGNTGVLKVYLGYLEEVVWVNTNGSFTGDASTWGRPSSIGGVIQTYPGNMNPSADLYTITMLAGIEQGEPTTTQQGFRISYHASVGALAATLAKVMPVDSRPPVTWGGLMDSNYTDEQAAGKWLAFGYGLFKGNDAEVIPAFWIPA